MISLVSSIKKQFTKNQSSLTAFGLLLLCVLLPGYLPAQIEKGLPFTEVYSPKTYKAHTQNFAVTQDNRGLMYFGNFAGILEYDGQNWQLIPTRMRVTSLLRTTGNKLFAVTDTEVGVVDAGPQGEPVFTPLITFKEKHTQFQHKLVESHGTIYTFSQHTVYACQPATKRVRSWETQLNIQTAFASDQTLFVVTRENNLLRFSDGLFSPVSGAAPAPDKIAAVLPLGHEEHLVVTRNAGLYKLKGSTLTPYIQQKQFVSLTRAIQATGDHFVLWSEENGLLTIDRFGKIVTQANSTAQINHEPVNDMFRDNAGNLWLALDNGIALINTASPLTFIDASRKGIVNDMVRYNGHLFVAATKGLFLAQDAMLKPVIQAGCWGLGAGQDALYVATGSGIYKIQGLAVSKLSGDFSFAVKPSAVYPGTIYVGAENSFQILRDGVHRDGIPRDGIPRDNKPVGAEKIAVPDNIVSVVEEPSGLLWLQSLSHGLYTYDPVTRALTNYSSKAGLGTDYGNQLWLSGNDLIAYNANGLFRFNASDKRFIPFSTGVFGSATEKWFSRISAEANGNLWTLSGDERQISLFKKEGAAYTIIRKPFSPVNTMNIRTIYPDGPAAVWFGGIEALIHYDRSGLAKDSIPFTTLIRKISVTEDTTRILYNGFTPAADQAKNALIFKSNFSGLSIDFSAPAYTPNTSIQYRYFLEGLDDRWSDWSTQATKEYSKLPYGSYTFHVKARDDSGNEGQEATFLFTIKTPFYLTWWAYLLYMISGLIVLFIVIKKRLNRADSERQLLENVVKERTEEIVEQKETLERQSEELSVKNDQLEKIDVIIQAVNAELDSGNLFQTILSRFTVIRNMDSATVLIVDQESGMFRFKALRGSRELAYVADVQITPEQAQKRYIDGAEEVFDDIYVKNHPDFEPLGNAVDDLVTPKSLLTIAIVNEQRTEGFITLENNIRPFAFDQRDLTMIRHLKEHLIAAYIKTRLLENLEITLKNLNNAQDELIRQEKLASVGQLTKGIVDRILNPINYVTNFSESSDAVLEEMIGNVETNSTGLSEEQLEDLLFELNMLKNNSRKIIEHGNSTTRILKDMQKLLTEKSTDFIETEFNHFIENKVKATFTQLKTEYNGLPVNLVLNTARQTTHVNILPHELSQAVSNIINNSFYTLAEKNKSVKEFTPEITVSTRTDEQYVYISIRDNGKGIPPRDLERLFSPFFTTKPTSKGTGLGLFMTKDIIQIHKGKINIQSKEGEFTEIYMALPVIS